MYGNGRLLPNLLFSFRLALLPAALMQIVLLELLPFSSFTASASEEGECNSQEGACHSQQQARYREHLRGLLQRVTVDTGWCLPPAGAAEGDRPTHSVGEGRDGSCCSNSTFMAGHCAGSWCCARESRAEVQV